MYLHPFDSWFDGGMSVARNIVVYSSGEKYDEFCEFYLTTYDEYLSEISRLKKNKRSVNKN